ncbi:hypothetical protein BDY19DRAFT_1051872 [Irpex rosettiformis]|uniref:Uncharacterized protein n=1 Tax=Irpex rosettiformis TaxID=378272 RepID=A0ACB8TMX5_9APHY|nr:hypothetical protein BDY19DRAFT_1051872 [Irpex rosettiformis]
MSNATRLWTNTCRVHGLLKGNNVLRKSGMYSEDSGGSIVPYYELTTIMSNDPINMRKNSGYQESQNTYRSRSTSRFLAQQAPIERLVQHHTFGNSVAGIRPLYTLTRMKHPPFN